MLWRMRTISDCLRRVRIPETGPESYPRKSKGAWVRTHAPDFQVRSPGSVAAEQAMEEALVAALGTRINRSPLSGRESLAITGVRCVLGRGHDLRTAVKPVTGTLAEACGTVAGMTQAMSATRVLGRRQNPGTRGALSGRQNLASGGRALSGGQAFTGCIRALGSRQNLTGSGRALSGGQNLASGCRALSGGKSFTGCVRTLGSGQSLTSCARALSGGQNLASGGRALSGRQRFACGSGVLSGGQNLAGSSGSLCGRQNFASGSGALGSRRNLRRSDTSVLAGRRDAGGLGTGLRDKTERQHESSVRHLIMSSTSWRNSVSRRVAMSIQAARPRHSHP